MHPLRYLFHPYGCFRLPVLWILHLRKCCTRKRTCQPYTGIVRTDYFYDSSSDFAEGCKEWLNRYLVQNLNLLFRILRKIERGWFFSIRMYAYKKFYYLYMKFLIIITRHGKVTSMSLAVRNGIHAISPLSMKYR